MQIYFLRHGTADWPDWDPAKDDERPLNREGVKKVRGAAKSLERLGLRFDVVLSSPLPRASQTAQIVAGQLGLEAREDKALAPGFDVQRLGELLRSHSSAQAILLVGHEPDFTRTISRLIGGGRISLKKGGLARINLGSLDPLRGELAWLVPAKLLQR